MRRATSGFTAHQDDASTTGDRSAAPLFLSPRNVERLVDKLSTMRGAALKLGQFLSIQDSHMLPPQVEEVLLRVQNSAHYMPAWQLERVMSEELGSEWRAYFASFDERPFAAASIGQVHSAVLADPFPSQPHLAGKRVAVKVQFPGVADSIVSDLANIKWLLTASALLPRGLFLENSVRQLQQELQEECDYMREAEMGRQFRKHVDTMSRPFGRLRFEAPEVVDVLSTRRVLTTEFMRGRPLVQVAQLDQTTRDMIAESVMELSLRELFDWHMMQTDPNWTNFLFHADRQAIQLIDFGATRAYSSEFITMWLGLLRAAVSGDRVMCERWSKDIGYLSGNEPETMRAAHVTSMLALGEPFRSDAPVPYPFAKQTITDRVRQQIPVMIRERLRPPPPETYSLNRKLSGAFLLCARLRANVNCRDLFANVTRPYPMSAPKALFHTQVQNDQYLGRDLLERWSHMPAHKRQRQQEKQLEQEVAVKEGARTMDGGPTTLRVRDVDVPVKPTPPGPEECCQSGCVNCVYTLYADDVNEHNRAMQDIRSRLRDYDPPITADEWDIQRLGPMPHASADELENERHTQDREARQAQSADPSLAAFLELERNLKKK